MTGSTGEAAELFDRAVEAFNLYRGDPIGLIDSATQIAPGFAMGHIFKAYLLVFSTEPAACTEAKAIIDQSKARQVSKREASHLSALGHLVAGEWTRAAVLLERHNAFYPHDLFAIQAGHLVDFYRAGSRALRDRIARVLPKWSREIPGYSILLGMYSFGLEEAGDYARAEAIGREALELQPLDCWAHHAVAHVMEMQGRPEDGIGWMIAREPHWSDNDNFFKVHNWWHRSLCHLELGQTDEVLNIYDGPIRGERSALALDLLDASAILWRLHLAGRDVGDRWNELAGAWDSHVDGKTYPFNDWHAAMAYLGADRDVEIDRLIRILRDGDGREAAEWGRRSALPLIEGFAAFWRGQYQTAVDRLQGARSIANSFGGSHAQRDIVDWTLTEAAIRGGMSEMAEALANERLALRPHSPVNLGFLRRSRTDDRRLQKAA